MLKVLRKKGVSKIILWFLAVIIILAFGFFGTAYDMESPADKKLKYAGKISGRKVPFTEFQNQLQQTVLMDKLNYGNNFKKIQHLLDQDRIQRTWTRILLINEANKRNIQISDQDLVNAIQNYPKFQTENKFDDLYYNSILKDYLGITPRKFEECFRDKLKIDKVTEQETAAISVTEEETRETYRQYNEKVQVSYILFANESFKNKVVIDEAKVQKFYEDHKSNFATPPMVNVEYLRFDFPITKTEKGKTTTEVSEAEKDEAWHKAYDARQELKTNPDFNAVAAKNNLQIQESGFFSMEQPNLKAGWPFELIQKIFAMKVDEISDPVETAQGYQILRMKESQAAAMPALSTIKDKVVDEWKTIEAAQLAKEQANATLQRIRTTTTDIAKVDFAKIAKDAGLEITQTTSFGRQENYLPKLGPAPDFLDKSFSLTTENPISDVAETSKGYCLIHLDNRTEADMKDFEKEKNNYASAILLEKKTKEFNDFLVRLRLKANLQSNLPEDKRITF